jgi:hypothetical protein
MALSCMRRRIRTSRRRVDTLQIVSRLSFAIGFMFLLFGAARSDAADSCLDNLPTPTPLLHRVVQLVNCSNQRVLGTANAAHVVGSPPTPVLPREKTWVLEPFPVPSGAPANSNVLTIDIPKEWGDTSPVGSTGPNFWVRTGCRYDVTNGLAQCETGGCSGFYDCSAALLGPPAGATLAEWTFYQSTTSGGNTYYLDHPDISAVNGVNLNLDIQPVGGSPANPINSQDPQWLAQNYPLTVHGADLRTAGDGLGQCSGGFQLKRSDLTGVTTPPTPPGQALFAFVISDTHGVPQDPAGDGTVGCFSNCGRYEFPTTPASDCSDTNADSRCFLHKAFCLYLPADSGVYGKTCNTDADCDYNGINYGIACWDNGNGTPVCSGRGFIKNKSCDPSVCTFQYGYLGSKAWQPPYAQCTDVSNDSASCIGDDTVHQVMRKAYTWPNDPQVYGGDAPLYRIVFAPGGTNVPITPSVGQAAGISTESGVPLCSALPAYYGYESLYSGPGRTECNKPCDVPVNSQCPGFKPPAARFAVAYPGATPASPWACNFNPQGGGGNNGVICQWPKE